MSEARRKEYSEALERAYQWDYAFVYVDAESITGHLQYHVNEQWNGATSIGYPSQLMAGSVVQAVDGDVFSVSNLSYSMNTSQNLQAMWHGNLKYTQGSSGGAWIVNISSEEERPDKNIIVGLNSFGNDTHPGASFGPLFTDDFAKLLNFVDGGCNVSKPGTQDHLMPSPFK